MIARKSRLFKKSKSLNLRFFYPSFTIIYLQFSTDISEDQMLIKLNIDSFGWFVSKNLIALHLDFFLLSKKEQS
jgi:hypothetical protein